MMNKVFLTLIIVAVLASMVMADGPAHKGNRYTGGEVLIIKLTDEQIRLLDDPNIEPAYLLKLTKEQRKIIRSKWGVAPTELEIWETRKGFWDCSCMSA